MKSTNIFSESDSKAVGHFRSGVSLHGHTLHSRESLDFIYKLAKSIAPIRFALDRGEARYQAAHGTPLDLTRAWWTPPCAPHDAWSLEAKHIENRLGMDAMVSLTDHDDIEAPMTLRVLEECRNAPVSVEWTVPYQNTFLHLGVHNIAPDHARETMSNLAAFTANPSDTAVYGLLESLAANRETLIVFNHPYWDENGIGEQAHRAVAREFAKIHQPLFHAFELNGLRPWKENRAVFELADLFQKPLISGGDRHALEPNTILNMTNAASFAEFVEEVREGYGDVFFTKQYFEPFTLRILQSLEDILSYQENHALGWRRWSDRAFYRCDDGVIRPLNKCWEDREPWAVTLFVRGLHLLRHPQLKHAFRAAFPRRDEAIL